MEYASIAVQGGLQFGPNGTGKTYISLHYHRSPVRGKSLWAIPPANEYGIFCTADTGNWRDKSGHYWGLADGGRTVVGTRHERLCKFWRPTNDIDPWHGHPVSPHLRGEDDAPDDALVETWIANGVVTKTLGRRIQRRKI